MADDATNSLCDRSQTDDRMTSSNDIKSSPSSINTNKRKTEFGNIEPSDAQRMIGKVVEADPAQNRTSLKVYRHRWLVLFVVALLNHSNTLTWISFASVSNYVDVFYGMSKAANWFSMIYILCTIPVGLFAMWMCRSFGLRISILIAAWANAIGTSLRLMSSFLPVNMRFPIGVFGQGIAACAYPFIMFLPSKVAGSWFSENQRALATTIGIMANPLGVLVANIASPQIVNETADVMKVNILVFVPSVIACLAATIGVTRSEPKTPPTRSAAVIQVSFFAGLKKCFTNRAYILLLIVMGGGIGMFNCLYTVIQQLLCAMGYANWFSGLCAALMIIGGIFGATVAGIFIDRTKLYEETMKVCMSLAVVCGMTFLQFALHPNLSIPLVITAFLFGVMGLAAYPVGLEMACECSFPVSETTSTGLVVLAGQIQSIAYVLLMNLTARPLQSAYMDIQVCAVDDLDLTVSKPQDSSYSVIAMSAVASAMSIVLVLFFKPTYKRLQLERGKGELFDGQLKQTTIETRQLDDLQRKKDEATVPLAQAENP